MRTLLNYTTLLLTTFILPTPQSLQYAEMEVHAASGTVSAIDPGDLPRALLSLRVVARRLELTGATYGTYEDRVLALRADWSEVRDSPVVDGVPECYPTPETIMLWWNENRQLQERVDEWGVWYKHQGDWCVQWIEYLKWNERVLDRVYEVVSPNYSMGKRRSAAKWLVKEFGEERFRSGQIPLQPENPFK